MDLFSLSVVPILVYFFYIDWWFFNQKLLTFFRQEICGGFGNWLEIKVSAFKNNLEDGKLSQDEIKQHTENYRAKLILDQGSQKRLWTWGRFFFHVGISIALSYLSLILGPLIILAAMMAGVILW